MHKNILKIGLFPNDRTLLHKQIKDRVRLMIKSGLIDEVKSILNHYPNIDDSYSSIKSVGYRQTYQYLNKQISKNELEDRIIFATRQLAKRQITWMRKMNNLELYDPFSNDLNSEIKKSINSFLK